MIIKVLSPLSSKPTQGVNDFSLVVLQGGEALDTHWGITPTGAHIILSGHGNGELHLQPPWLKHQVTYHIKLLKMLKKMSYKQCLALHTQPKAVFW